MGLTKDQKYERAMVAREITTSDVDGQDEYVFISYKSDDWKVVLDKVVRHMVDTYGLRVYFDKNFDRDNDIWVKNMSKAIGTSKCRAVLAFVSKKYMVSYACLMELLTARSKTTYTKYDDYKKLPIIPIIVDDSADIRDAMSKSAKEVVIKEQKEYLELLEDTKKSPWVRGDEKLTFWLEQLAKEKELTEEGLSSVAEIILRKGHERYFVANRLESDFFDNLKTTIEKCSKTVFDPNLIKKKTTTPAEPAAGSPRKNEPETSADAGKDSSGTNSVKTDSASSPQEPDNELKIGELVRTELKRLLIEKATAEEIQLMQEKEYSRKTFGIQYPLLLKTSQKAKEPRYYSELIVIRGEQYRLCSEWYEKNKPYVEKWIKEHQ